MTVDEVAAPPKAVEPENEKEKQDEVVKPTPPPAGPPSITYPGVWHYSVLAFALLLAMFLVALDIVSMTSLRGGSWRALTRAEYHCHSHPNHHGRVSQR